MAFVYFNPNPNGNSVGDCTIRAISLLMDQDWRKTYIGLVTIYLYDRTRSSVRTKFGEFFLLYK